MTTPTRTHYACPTCGTSAPISGDGRISVERSAHAPDCPAGRALRAVLAEDVQWLLDRPHAPHRWRAADVVELADLAAVGIDVTAGRWRVCVTPHRDGVVRMICTDRRPVLWVVDDFEVVAR